ncbi:erythromycin esterase family protein [Amycolatopsis sp. NPDC098790]|uniref:erythromycin esterase family protein n=1 Tax=Amycolatopsis sp. NPDC098790 TaxID=3363939 RepID=UPI0038156178
MSGTLLTDETAIRAAATPLRSPQDLDPLVRRIGRARIVLLGEATHGTAEFFRWRAELTQRLLAERDFSFVAVDGDWPECHRLHSCVAGAPGAPNDPGQALWGFRGWPTWRWANEEVAEFARWLRAFNATGGVPCGFHGLDVFSLGESLRSVLGFVREHVPDRLEATIRAFRCFEPDEEDRRYSAGLVPENRREEVVRLLTSARAGVPGAEDHYRELLHGGARARNVRATHLSDTLDRLLEAYGPRSKAVVWAHNSHVGGILGWLSRGRHAAEGVVTVGFGTHRGSVIAAGHWGGPGRRTTVEPARPDSFEGVLHDAVPGEDSLFVFGGDDAWAHEPCCQRAIGVVHRGDGYVPTVPAARYDAFVHCDETTAITPLHHWEPEDDTPFLPVQTPSRGG